MAAFRKRYDSFDAAVAAYFAPKSQAELLKQKTSLKGVVSLGLEELDGNAAAGGGGDG